MKIKDVFSTMEKDASGSKFVDWKFYQNQVEQISLNAKSSAIMVAILFAATLVLTTLVEELRIAKDEHELSVQRLIISAPHEDSIQIVCPHCGLDRTFPMNQLYDTSKHTQIP